MEKELAKKIKEKLGYMPIIDPVMMAVILSVIEYKADKIKQMINERAEFHANTAVHEHEEYMLYGDGGNN